MPFVDPKAKYRDTFLLWNVKHKGRFDWGVAMCRIDWKPFLLSSLDLLTELIKALQHGMIIIC